MSVHASTTVRGESPPPPPVRIARAVDAVMIWSASVVASITLPVLFVSICIDVIIRYVTKQSISWLSEVQSIMFPWLIMSGVAIAALWGRHIALDAVTRLMPKNVAKAVLFCIQGLAALTFFYLTWVGIDVLDVAGDEIFPVTGLRSSWAYMALVIGFFYLAMTSVSNLVLLVHADDPFVFRWGLEEEGESLPQNDDAVPGEKP